jgi:hypothetical protein
MEGLTRVLKYLLRSVLLCFIVFPLFISSCVYEFVLGGRASYGRYETLYIERALNPSGAILDVEILEDEIQKKLIQNFPDIRLSSKEDAHLYMRLTCQNLTAELAAVDTVLSDSLPNNLILESGKIKAPHQLEKLTRSDHGYLKGDLKLVVVVEVWDVYKRERIFIKSYMSENFYNPFFHPMYRLLELDLVERSILKSVSEPIALQLTSDLAHVL